MTNKINDKTKQLVDDLLHNSDKYELLINEYFSTFDIESIGLTYDHFENDIIKVYAALKDILTKIEVKKQITLPRLKLCFPLIWRIN